MLSFNLFHVLHSRENHFQVLNLDSPLNFVVFSPVPSLLIPRLEATISCKCNIIKEQNKLKLYKVELNYVRHMVKDVSCPAKNLDLRLMLCTKRIIAAPKVDMMDFNFFTTCGKYAIQFTTYSLSSNILAASLFYTDSISELPSPERDGLTKNTTSFSFSKYAEFGYALALKFTMILQHTHTCTDWDQHTLRNGPALAPQANDNDTQYTSSEKFGAFFPSIPLPIFSAAHCILFGLVGVTCIKCGNSMNKELKIMVNDSSSEVTHHHEDGAFVKGEAMYLIFDDLKALLNKWSPRSYLCLRLSHKVSDSTSFMSHKALHMKMGLHRGKQVLFLSSLQ
ncbi:hypothetical protein S83_052295, partial [Arachis hypogaea]